MASNWLSYQDCYNFIFHGKMVTQQSQSIFFCSFCFVVVVVVHIHFTSRFICLPASEYMYICVYICIFVYTYILNQKRNFRKVGLKLIRLNTLVEKCVYVVVYTDILLWEIGQIITSYRTILSVLTKPPFSCARTGWTYLVYMCWLFSLQIIALDDYSHKNT